MFLIADGGSTKTDWSIVSGNQEIDRIKTRGINPFFQTEEDISAEIRDNLVPKIKPNGEMFLIISFPSYRQELEPVPKIQAIPGLLPQRARAAASKSLPTSTGTGR